MSPLRRRAQPTHSPAGAVPIPAASDRPEAPAGARNLVMVVFDSLRFDSAMTAGMPMAARLGNIERRWSYASWTAPSHYNLLMGLLPHRSPPHVYASEYYKQDFARYSERLGLPGIEFRKLLPSLYLPTYLRAELGYVTSAFVSMPVLNPATPVNRDFDSYTLMPTHNDFGRIVQRLEFDAHRPSFVLLNAGETHYPYALPDEDPTEWPRISGVHGVVKRMDGDLANDREGDGDEPSFFDQSDLDELRERQVAAARHVDGVLEALFDVVPTGTWVVVTSDHGELFGESGFFGHGPIAHEKVFEVPFVEGLVR